MSDRPTVRNASDPKQVAFARRRERDTDARWLAALRETLSTPAGRHVIWSLLRRAGIYNSIWDPSSRVHYNAGRQDYGHELLAECLRASEDLYELMEREARQQARADARETDAVHTQRAADGG